jgi:hypothetical protein
VNGVDRSDQVRAFLAKEGISQQALAIMAKVSQSTVSRAVNRQALRPSPARIRLFTFMQEQGATPVPDPALRALTDIWDGSDEHATALAQLIRASEELWPNLARE